MIDDPLFYLAAVPAVLLAGISKGGFGGGLGTVAVPLMALLISPVQAAAIMLPILCAMDLVGVWAYWRKWDRRVLILIAGAAMLGIALGTLSFRFMEPWAIRLLLGVIAVGFALSYWRGQRRAADNPGPRSLALHPRWGRLWGGFWGAVSGFTSFTAHAGGPPLQVYLFGLAQDKTTYQATTVIFFLLINYVKLLPYAWLGQFSATNLATAGVLMPVAFVGVLTGVRIHDKVPQALFFKLCYGLLFLTGLKLLYDGIEGLL